MREESRAVYRQAIMEAAMRIFGQTGFRDAKIADIATEAGVATGTLYNYFSSKEDIFQSILDDGRIRVREALGSLIEIEDPLERLRALIASLLDFLEQHGSLFAIYVQLVGAPTHLRPSDEGEEAFRHELLVLMQTAITEAGPRLRGDHSTLTLTTALGGLINGTIVGWVEGGCQPGLREQVDTIMDLFLNGAAPR
ncbi:MAG: TetR/AcrR family transcriptional regulator [Myxococcales bacterium]|nr:TetR/AcrR family transcriptional regulator [Myxococcales bacterium]MCA9700363.1 TetR/AcrR family transcriptional regulator [Myxococcales bacterium]